MSEASSARSGNFRLTASIIASAMFMEQLDATVLTTASPCPGICARSDVTGRA